MSYNIGIHGLGINWNFFLSYKTIVMVFAVQCSMLLNVIEHKIVIEHRYSWTKHQLELVSFIRDYCNGICSSVFYVINSNKT